MIDIRLIDLAKPDSRAANRRLCGLGYERVRVRVPSRGRVYKIKSIKMGSRGKLVKIKD